jgi:3-isopropylmalate/(R)-2-methylmalate dehydratase large subunit
MGQTLYEKIWQSHFIAQDEGAPALLFVDLHLVHEVTSPQAFSGLKKKGLSVRRTDRTFITIDHAIPTRDQKNIADPQAKNMVQTIRDNARESGIKIFDLESGKQGIVHVIGPELGLTQPGTVIVCGDSHTATHGAFGSLAFGIGTSEVEQVMATQCLMQSKAKTMQIDVSGKLAPGVTAKDIILYIINVIGVAGGTGYVVEYTGDAIHALNMEERMTICNMSIEAGAKAGMISPDKITVEYMRGKEYAPQGAEFEKAAEVWLGYASDSDAQFDKSVIIKAEDIKPRITYGTNPGMSVAIDESIPTVDSFKDDSDKMMFNKAIAYMGLTPGQKIAEQKIDNVFIGSCTNSRISDLRSAASIVKGQHVAINVSAIVVPGSQQVKKMAEDEGLDKIFVEAGFEWRNAGCSSCLAMNDDKVPAGKYCVSTSNRNFEGRQGPNSRTFLASPMTAAASAISGFVTDPRKYI